MKTILAIQTYPGANQTFERHVPFYRNAGADRMFAITTTDGLCRVPVGFGELQIGKNAYLEGDHLCRRLMDTIAAILEFDCEQIAVIEYDAIFLRRIQDNLEPGVHAVLAGHNFPGVKCKSFYHCPWIFDRATAEKILSTGRALIEAGEKEMGSPDAFLGLCIDVLSPNVFNLRDTQGSYSVNTLDIPSQREEARNAILNGALSVHGAKTQEQLDFILRK